MNFTGVPTLQSAPVAPRTAAPCTDPGERALLAPYLSDLDESVYALRGLPEEVVAVLFAYYSRSQGSLRESLLRLLREGDLALAPGIQGETGLEAASEKARQFHEKWVVGYGHASVAEHAVAHIAVEDVSILVSKVIEDCRLASYTEKSTRYVPFPRAAYTPAELPSPLDRLYDTTLRELFDAYEVLLQRLTAHMQGVLDRSQFRTEAGWLNGCRAQACDALRGLLPAAAVTNLGITANARTLEGMISKLLSHPLPEAQAVGRQIRDQAQLVIPTLIKYARPSEYRIETLSAMDAAVRELIGPAGNVEEDSNRVRLVAQPDGSLPRLAAAILYDAAHLPYEELLERVNGAGEEKQKRVIEEYLARRRRYGSDAHGYTDPPLRGLEHLSYTFEIVVDYGAYRDIQRHRMATQADQLLTCSHGYEVPQPVVSSGCEAQYHSAMGVAAEAWKRLESHSPHLAQYVIPLAYRKRMLITWNLRELHHFITLRSARQGHASYRAIAQAVYNELAKRQPFLAGFIRVDLNEYDITRPG